ncbi:CMP-5'-phosphonoformate--3-phosphoglycerate phosphonoformyl transferase [Streptomyces sp. NBC_00847]|uniref:CMP-5'-phosphonoformate--3-phosphoglycerate phosphonoformyl transferase n=1 Tax=unclassified Streptomyces TaxID=2593676 RepID=UPI0022519D19|nr:CMP-5'-phosphonoformate--3-phosphoglycerate phosphonoformyl transferase [Streptomyces sp. NBC_00847]MCX4881501.1 CMP-5'-phosphonoformate--3-phosphoglycerate phosphonoformyl transferase [Streptomyces sp. NBC_00847]
MSASGADTRTAGPDGTPPAGRLFITVLCGGADRPVAELGGLTPFEAAATPHLDALARRGSSAALEVIAPDVPPESDSGAMALLGYDPVTHYTGRGPLEGLGMDFWQPDGYSVAFRVNFASWDPATGRLDRRTSRDLDEDDQATLVEEITGQVSLGDGVTFRLTGFGRHRGILGLTSDTVPLSGKVTNTDPGFVSRGPFGVPVNAPSATPATCVPFDEDPAAATTAELVNRFVAASAEVMQRSEVNARRRALGRRPANLLLVRDAGDTLPRLADFTERTGLTLSMYGQVPAERGLARLIGARFTSSRPARGQSEPDYYRELLPQLLADPADAVFVHIKGPDEPGHDGRPRDKVRAIEEIDAHFVGPLADALTAVDTLVVTCDHATPCELGIHSPDRVPAVAVGPRMAADSVADFGEKAALGGQLGASRASDLLSVLLAAPDGGRG